MNKPDRQPVEVWLTQRNLAVDCRIVREDETSDDYDMNSMSLRGAQREITGYLIGQGYRPAGRWETAAEDDRGAAETVRRFAVASA